MDRTENFIRKIGKTYEMILDCSSSGKFQSPGCERSFGLAEAWIDHYGVNVLGKLDDISMDIRNCATQNVHIQLLEKATCIVAPYFENDEEALFYKDSAVFFQGKDGLLVTNKALYRIRKNGVKKLNIANIQSLHLEKILFETEENECVWFFNNDRNFDLNAISITEEHSSFIMALILSLFKDSNPNHRIKFFNY